jgi:hypothetical protein
LLGNFGYAQFRAGNSVTALATMREAVRIANKAAYPGRGRALLKLGLIELSLNEATAEKDLRDARDLLAGSSMGADGYLELARAAHGAALASSGDANGGETEARAARADLIAGKAAGSKRVGDVDLLLAGVLETRGDKSEADTLRRQARQVFARVLGEAHPKTQALR